MLGWRDCAASSNGLIWWQKVSIQLLLRHRSSQQGWLSAVYSKVWAQIFMVDRNGCNSFTNFCSMRSGVAVNSSSIHHPDSGMRSFATKVFASRKFTRSYHWTVAYADLELALQNTSTDGVWISVKEKWCSRLRCLPMKSCKTLTSRIKPSRLL